MNDPHDSTITDDSDSLSPSLIEFCAKVRNNDPAILPELGKPLRIRDDLNEKKTSKSLMLSCKTPISRI
jgi:hypothetical protein